MLQGFTSHKAREKGLNLYYKSYLRLMPNYLLRKKYYKNEVTGHGSTN